MREFRFHNNFMLNRDRLSAMFRCVAEDPAAAKESIAAAMGVNPYMVEGFRGWLCKTGLGSFAPAPCRGVGAVAYQWKSAESPCCLPRGVPWGHGQPGLSQGANGAG